MKRLLLKGGRVIDPANGRDGIADVLLSDGLVEAVDDQIEVADAEVVDCSGLLVTPGLVDTNVHLNEPGREDRETIATGTRAAALGGYTALGCRSTEGLVMDNQTVVRYLRSRSARDGVVRVYPIGTATKGKKGKRLTEIGEIAAAGAVAISDDAHCVDDASMMRRILLYAEMFSLPVFSFPQDTELAAEGLVNEGAVSTQLGLAGIPAVAEEVIVGREMILAESLDCAVHLSPISSACTVELLRYAQEKGIKLSAEVTPHNLLLTDAACKGYQTDALVSPPLRGEADRMALIEAVVDGTIAIIATDHSPCTVAEKRTEFTKAVPGIAGLETAFPLLFTRLVEEGHVTLSRLVDSMSTQPARLLNLALGTLTTGLPADVSIFDPVKEREVDVRKFKSKGKNNPFDGWSLRGWSVHTIVGGKFIVRDGELTAG